MNLKIKYLKLLSEINSNTYLYLSLGFGLLTFFIYFLLNFFYFSIYIPLFFNIIQVIFLILFYFKKDYKDETEIKSIETKYTRIRKNIIEK